ncbi:hypothetical protein P3E18_11795, partial [Pseudomonas aeruginosa]
PRLLMVLIAPLLATPLSAAVPAAFNQPAEVVAVAAAVAPAMEVPAPAVAIAPLAAPAVK